MFPYPSGKLHVGHVRNYTMGDLVARYRRAQGFNVLHPMGWDAFGLPAENAAIAEKIHPAVWTCENIATMRAQLQRMGFAYDWSREIATCHPEYYRHEQKMFLDFLAAGLAYRKESWVNWDPVENTVLANEQVIDGRGWRSGAIVEKRLLSQWFLRITAYTEELLDAIGGLERWPERVRLMQENWIGRSEGARVFFDDRRTGRTHRGVHDPPGHAVRRLLLSRSRRTIRWPLRLAENDAGLAAFIAECNRMGTSEAVIETAEKRGYRHRARGAASVRPEPQSPGLCRQFRADGIRHRRDLRLPGARPARPRIRPQIRAAGDPGRAAAGRRIRRASRSATSAYVEDGTLFNSDFLDGLPVAEAKRAAGGAARRAGPRRARDRLPPARLGGVAPALLGLPDPGHSLRGDAGSCRCRSRTCRSLCPRMSASRCRATRSTTTRPGSTSRARAAAGRPAARPTPSTLFSNSSWYFLRFCSARAPVAFEREAVDYWMPVDQYIGGVEHAVLHLLYSRFFTRALKQCGYLDLDEPFAGLSPRAWCCHQTYQSETGEWLFPEEVDTAADGQLVDPAGRPVTAGRSEKMSKSKKNVVGLDAIVDTYGADTARLYLLSDSPPERDLEWTETGIEGIWRYVNRLWRMASEPPVNAAAGRVAGPGAGCRRRSTRSAAPPTRRSRRSPTISTSSASIARSRGSAN